MTVSAGIGQSIILGGIARFGYIAPESTTQIIQQPDAMRTFFTWTFIGVPMVGYVIGSLLMLRFDVEEKIPQISADITDRHRAEAEARGELYYSPEEKAAISRPSVSRTETVTLTFAAAGERFMTSASACTMAAPRA